MKSMHITQALALTAILFALPLFAHADQTTSRLRMGVSTGNLTSRASFGAVPTTQPQSAPQPVTVSNPVVQGSQAGNNNGGATSGNGGNGGTGATGGTVTSGNTSSSSNTMNIINTTIIRITLGR